MAKTLLETIRSNISAPNRDTPQLGETERAQELLRAKTGKLTAPSTAPRQSGLQEKLAARQTQLGSEQLQQAGRLTAEEQRGQELDIAERARQATVQAGEQRLDQEQRFQNTATNIIEDFQRGIRSLDNQQDIARLEQAGFMTRLMNKEYLNNLQIAANMQRLDNDLNFKEQLYRDIFAEQEQLMRDNAEFRQAINMDDAEFNNMLGKMKIDHAIDIARNAGEAAAAQQTASAVGDLASAGIQAGSKAGWFSEETDKGAPNTVGVSAPATTATTTRQRGVTPR